LGGIKNIIAKQLGTKNLLNNAKATIDALLKLQEQIKNLPKSSIRKIKFYKNILTKI
jgi:ribosomal protein S5